MIDFKYVLKKPLPEGFKMMVTPEQSEALQKEILSNGAKWLLHGGTGRVEKGKKDHFLILRDKMIVIEPEPSGVFYNDIEIKFEDYFTLEHAKTVSPTDEAISNLEEQVKALTTTLNKWKEANLFVSTNGEAVEVKLPKDTDPRVLLYWDMLSFAANQNGDWQPRWEWERGEENSDKYGLTYEWGRLSIKIARTYNHFVFGISFETKESAEKAQKQFEERIYKYYGK